jgi:peptidyl-prolyl cis-trans isomerase SurA
MYPKVTDEEKLVAKRKIEKIKKDIEGGADFSLQAILYSEDPGSAADGGALPVSERGDLVPEFEAAAYKLDEKKMSDIVETPFGFHLIMLDEKRGNKVKVRHILIKPKTTYADIDRVKGKMDTVLIKLQSKALSFREAVSQYSDDEPSKALGGLMTNPKNGSTLLDKSEIEGSLIFTLDHMQVGDYSEVLPHNVPTKTGEEKRGYRILYLKSESKPHKASLETDYSKIHAAAKQKKQMDELSKWIGLNKGHFYFKMDPDYHSLTILKKWFTTDK